MSKDPRRAPSLLAEEHHRGSPEEGDGSSIDRQVYRGIAPVKTREEPEKPEQVEQVVVPTWFDELYAQMVTTPAVDISPFDWSNNEDVQPNTQ